MEKRLLLAKKLLKDTGVIFVAIGDDEHHRLRSLMDQVFGEQNFISNIVWQGGIKNNAQFTGGGVDYMVTYAVNRTLLSELKPWREKKRGLDSVLVLAKESWEAAGASREEATRLFRSALRQLKPDLDPGVYRYNTLDNNGRPYFEGDLSAPGGNGQRYTVLHPETGKECKTPSRGWAWTESRMKDAISRGLVLFGVDESRSLYLKRYLEEMDTTSVYPSFVQDRRSGSKNLELTIGDKRFPFPKDHEVLMRWFRMAAPKDAVVLDFFGGSGTTAEAVMRLNTEDGGTRQAILVTNNELSKADDTKLRKAGHKPGDAEYEALGVFHHVTKPRLKTVATGIREDGSTYSDGLEANLAFMEFKYLEEVDILQGRSINDLAGLFWLKAGGRGTVPVVTAEDERRGYALSDGMAILLSTGAARELKSEVNTRGISLDALFIVTDSDAQGDEAAALFAGTPVIERIYGPYLESFQVNKNG